MSLTLLHSLHGGACYAAILVLEEKGVEWLGRPLDEAEALSPWHVRLNPTARPPTLLHGDDVVVGIADIARYIEATFDGPTLAPAGDEARATMEHFVELAARFPFAHLAPRSALRRRRSQLEALAFHNPELGPAYTEAMRQTAPDEDAPPDTIIEHTMDEAERALQQSRYLTGSRYTLADAVFTAVMSHTVDMGRGYVLHHRPALRAWWGRVRRRSSYRRSQAGRRLAHHAVARGVVTAVRLFVVALVVGLIGAATWAVKRRRDR